MNNIIINTTNINTYETLISLANATGKSLDTANELWDTMVLNSELLGEFIYYIEHGTINDKLKVNGIGLSDLYVSQLKRYNLFVSDLGKNTSGCNKAAIMFDTFVAMGDLIKNPGKYKENDFGMDMF